MPPRQGVQGLAASVLVILVPPGLALRPASYNTGSARRRGPLAPPGVLLPCDRVRRDAEYLEHQVGRIQCRVPRGIEGWGDLANVAADDVEPDEAPQHHLAVAHAEPARLRHAGSDRVDRIEAVDVEGDVGGAIAHGLADLLDDLGAAHRLVIVHGDDAHARVLAVAEVVVAVARAAQADLDHALGIDQPV